MFRGMEFLSVKWPLELWFSECHPEKPTDGVGVGAERMLRTAKQLKEVGKPNLGAIRKVPGKPVREKERLIVRNHLTQGYFLWMCLQVWNFPRKVVHLPEVSAGITKCLCSCKRLPYWLAWDQSCEGPRNNLED